MAGINNNLYPPIIDTYMPAFIYKVTQEGCRVYFSISVYNSLSEINTNAIQVIVQDQNTNQSMLAEDIYPSGIKLAQLKIDTEEGQNKYYINILPSDMQGGTFLLGQYYKVQIRFTLASISTPEKDEIDSWISNNFASFSEWSTVTLIKPISAPILTINNFDQQADSIYLTSTDLTISGKITFEEEDDDETLTSYRISLYDTNENLLTTSGDIYADPYKKENEIYYQLKYPVETNVDYILGFQILTRNLYSWPTEQRFNFSVDEVIYHDFVGTITAEPDNLGGRIKINVISEKQEDTELKYNVIIRRSSSRDNFKVWEDIKVTNVSGLEDLDYTWYDYTAEPGVWYKYCAMTQNTSGFRSKSIQTESPVIINPEDIFLTAEGKQLKVRFDPNISSFSHHVAESKIDTIGSQYPFFYRNDKVNYRTFSLSGTISHFMDIRQNLMQSSKKDLYGQNYDLYQQYNQDNRITLFNDDIFEREFRKNVIDFLYKNNVKLFRSATEGNILVKLMDISFTPNITLHRHIYSFSCTAYQVDACNISNYIKYNIYNFGTYDFSIEQEFDVLGQLYKTTGVVNIPKLIPYEKKNSVTHVYTSFKNTQQTKYLNKNKVVIAIPKTNKATYLKFEGESDYYRKNSAGDYQLIKGTSGQKYYEYYKQSFSTADILKTYLNTKYQRYYNEKYITEVQYLKYLKIHMISPPYSIAFSADGTPVKTTNTDPAGRIVGYIVLINGQPVVIKKDGIFELTDNNTKITTLSFKYAKQQACIDYIAHLSQRENTANIPKSYSNIRRISQYWGYFNSKDSIVRRIKRRYNQSYNINPSSNIPLYRQNLQGIIGMRISAEPGTVFYIKQNLDSGLEKYVVNETGLIEFYDQKTNIQEFYFSGQIINKNDLIDYKDLDSVATVGDATVGADVTGYEPSDYQIPGFDETKKYVNNQIYYNLLDQKEYLYQDSQWYAITRLENNQVYLEKPVNAIVDYYCNIVRRRY